MRKVSVRKYLSNFALCIISRLFKVRNNQIAFIPYAWMAKEKYDLLNYKSDNTLSLLNYILENYSGRFSLRLACDISQLDNMKKIIDEKYHSHNISVFPYFGKHKYRKEKYVELMRSKLIFASEGFEMPYKKSKQKIVFLGYFKPFKDDYKFHHLELKDNYEKLFDKCISPSLIYSNIISHTYNISFSKFVTLGFSRDDELLKSNPCPKLDDFINERINYKYSKVILYTPTHRDYESRTDTQRSVLGFDFNKEKMEQFLQSNGVVIICKIHSNQNIKVINDTLPKGMIIHIPNSYYGLCELMQKSDCLITDYTSAYFDYLLLNRPVLFNFYDFEKYKQTRGFSFDPIEPLLAGDIFSDEDSFYEKMNIILSNKDYHKTKREWVRDLMHSHMDQNSSKRICMELLDKNID